MRRTVRDAMTPGPVSLRHDARVREAARQMKRSDIGDVVVTRDEKPYGILTDRDIVLRCVAEGGDPGEMRVGDVCSTHLVSVAPNEPLAHAEELMRRRALRRLLVVDDGQAVGMVSLADVERALHPESATASIAEAPPNR